ncbi:hypothetical protein BU17DRAFT_86307 [Hysterangium stoloniferum]|nr:hypothetical protein BU17DRAFT_86307 [Hysterangium stoloniferum]
MSFPYNNYPDTMRVHQFGPFYEDGSQVTELDISTANMMHDEPFPNLIRTFHHSPPPFTPESGYIAYPIQNQHSVYDDLALTPVLWDVDGPHVHAFPPSDLGYAPEAFSALHHRNHAHVQRHHHPSYSPEQTYTRMFRGRKSKSAAEVLDELRPYACDICQAAFARSHDRDRHKRSHTGETPYRCHGCGTGFKRPDARKRHWERDPICAQEDWLRVRHTPEGAKRRARAKTKPSKKTTSE